MISRDYFETMVELQLEAMRKQALSDVDPTTVDQDIYWIWSIHDKEYHAVEEKNQTGKWLVFCLPKEVNSIWQQIRVATQKGKLGFASKCSTKLSFEGKGQNKQYVICVYTKNYKDMEDVTRVREELRDMAIDGKIPYKTDEMTVRKISGSKYYF